MLRRVIALLLVAGGGLGAVFMLACAVRPAPGPMTEAEVAAALRGTDTRHRQKACWDVHSLRPLPPALVGPIMAVAAGGDEDTRHACLSALQGAGAAGREAIPMLRTALTDTSPYVRLAAATSLGEIAAEVGGDTRVQAIRAMVPLVSDQDPLMRRFALVGLQRLRADSDEAIAACGRALSDETTDTRQGALRALGVLGPAAAPAAPELVGALRHPDALTRHGAAEVLGNIGPAAGHARPALLEALKDPVPEVRKEAVTALPKVEPAASGLAEILALVLDDRDHGVRGAAIVALESLGPKAAPAVPALMRVLSGREIYLRVWAVEALGAIGPAARPALPRLRAMVGEKPITNESEAGQIPVVVPAAIAKIEGAS